MAYNVLSGTVQAPGELRAASGSTNIVSGSFYGDGAGIDNIPRVTNAGDNRILTVVGSDANSLNAESNFTFSTTSGIVTGKRY